MLLLQAIFCMTRDKNGKLRNIILICVGCITLIGGLVEIVKIVEANKHRDQMMVISIKTINQKIARLDNEIEKIRDKLICSKR